MLLFWNNHQIVLVIILNGKSHYSLKKSMIMFILFFRGLLACAGFFLVFGMTQTPDGVFVRPHPGKFKRNLSLIFTRFFYV